MTTEVWVELVKQIPAILTALVALVAAVASIVAAVISRRVGEKTEANSLAIHLVSAKTDEAKFAIHRVDAKTDVVQAQVENVKAKVEEVKTEVKTGNAQSLAQLADKAESRRIDLIPAGDRTPVEVGHLHTVEQSEQALAAVALESAITKERDKQAAAGSIEKRASEESAMEIPKKAE